MPPEPDLKKILDELVESNRLMKLALFGDENIGVTGVIKRLGSVEGRQRHAERGKIYLVGFVAVAGGVVTFVINYLMR